jgi:hypothetical protein
VRRRVRATGEALRALLPERRRWLHVYRDLLDDDGHSGVVVLDTGGRVRLWSDGAAALLGATLPPGTPVAGAPLSPAAAEIIAPGRPRAGGTAVLSGRVLRFTRRPVTVRGRAAGWATVVRDDTRTERLAAQLQAERDSTVALRARAHEADNRLHTVVSLVELGHIRQAVDFATAVLARSQEMHESIHSTVADPVLAALLTGTAVCADEAGVALHVDPNTCLPPTGLPPQDLVLILGTSSTPASPRPRRCRRRAGYTYWPTPPAGGCALRSPTRGRGYRRGRSTTCSPPGGRPNSGPRRPRPTARASAWPWSPTRCAVSAAPSRSDAGWAPGSSSRSPSRRPPRVPRVSRVPRVPRVPPRG